MTSDDALDERVRMLRFHGSRDKQTFELVGHNSRLDEMQAALLRITLPHLDRWCDGRRAAAAAYEEAGLGELVALPVHDPRRTAGLASLRRPPRARRRAARGALREGHRRARLLPRAGPPPARDARVAPPVAQLRGTDEAARTNFAVLP